MKDKELQELFAANRTTEANRRRQEELRKLLEAQSAPRSRRLWPVWTLSAAASIALLVIVLPLLFRNVDETPMLVAHADTSKVNMEETDRTEKTEPTATRETKETKEAKETKMRTESTETAVTIRRMEVTDIASEEIAMVEEAIVEDEEQEQEVDVATQETTIDNTPHIYRRTSTRLANSRDDNGNSGRNAMIHDIPATNGLQNLLASLTPEETNTPIILKAIEI